MRFTLRPEDTDNLLTALYFLEGLIVLLVRKMDKKNINMVDVLETKIKKLFDEMFKAGKSTKIILPRYLTPRQLSIRKPNSHAVKKMFLLIFDVKTEILPCGINLKHF